ncbi:NAD(P)H-dependent oxidoreductase subunit E [Thermodesulfobacteriota bacterium]
MKMAVKIDWEKIEAVIGEYDGTPADLLMIMQDISDIYNYLPPEVIPFLATKLGVKESLIYGVATFYKNISLEPRGKYIISVCTGTACHVRGAEKIMGDLQDDLSIGENETTKDLLFTLEAVRCIGCCALGPVIRVNQETHGGLDRSSALKTIEEYKQHAS